MLKLPTIYLLNTPVLTAYGQWRFEGPLPPERAREALGGGFVSAVGHEGAARFLAELLGLDVPARRVSVEMRPGDRAVVLRLKERLPEGRTLTRDEMRDLAFELGLLTCLPAGTGFSPAVDRALAVAALAHDGVPRKGKVVPYIMHPFHVALILDRHGCAEDLVVAGILHDVLEDADWASPEVRDRLRRAFRDRLQDAPDEAPGFRREFEALLDETFGPAAMRLVRSVTEQKTDASGTPRSWRQRKDEALEHLRHAAEDEAALKAADLLHNVRSIADDLRAEGIGTLGRFNARPEQMLAHYAQVADVLRDRLRVHPALAAELDGALDDLRGELLRSLQPLWDRLA